MCTRRTESEVLTRGKGMVVSLSAPRSLADAKYRRHMICTMRREILLVCATTCVRAHAGSASGTESHRSRDLDLPRDERPTNIRYSVVEFTGLVQVQMSPQGRTLRRHSNRRPDVQRVQTRWRASGADRSDGTEPHRRRHRRALPRSLVWWRKFALVALVRILPG